jgi:type I restriction enzyme S subunit
MKRAPLNDLLILSDSGVWGDEDPENGVSVLRSTNFNSDGWLNFGKPSFRAIDPKKRDAKLLREGDILLEKSGGGPQQPVGRVCLFRGSELPQSFGNFIARLRPTDEVLSEYLFYFLWRFHASGKTSHYQKQTTGIRNLEFKRFLTIEVPVPPIDEQRRIVDILSRTEGIVRLQHEAQRKAAELIPGIFLDMFGDPATNPKGWDAAPLGELCEIKGGGTPSKQNPDFWIGEIPWVSPKDMSGIDFIVDAEDHISSNAVKGSATNLIPVGSVLIVTRSGVLKHTIPCAITAREVAINQDIKAFVPRARIAHHFLLSQIQIRSKEILGLVRVGATVQNIETESLRRMRFICPSFENQIKFSDKWEQVRSIQAQQAAATVKAEATFSALLGQVFSAN